VLLIDGEAGSERGESESFYLERALAPNGPIRSGIVPQVVSEDNLDSVKFEDFPVIFWLNGDGSGTSGSETISQLERWVDRGGRLVLMPGDQTDRSLFNSQWWREGNGLSPLRLEAKRGDGGQSTWVGLQFSDTDRALQQYAGHENPLFNHVKCFQWWEATTQTKDAANGVTVWARFDDAENSPAVAQKSFGKGQVVGFAIPADADWDNWPSHPSYVLLFQDLVHALARNDRELASLLVGQTLRQPVDLARYEREGELLGPRLLETKLQAVPPEGLQAPSDATTWEIRYPLRSLGFYEVKLTQHEGGQARRLFATNAAPEEGDLKRVDPSWLRRELADTHVQVLDASEIEALTDGAARAELWWYLAWLLVGVLAGEQWLGWLFGRGRS
jgi:hypothetical protein